MSPDETAPIRARLAAATPGPWESRDVPSDSMVQAHTRLTGPAWDTVHWRNGCGSVGGSFEAIAPHDADLIANAPTDLATLLRLVDEARAEVFASAQDAAQAIAERDAARRERDAATFRATQAEAREARLRSALVFADIALRSLNCQAWPDGGRRRAVALDAIKALTPTNPPKES